MELSCKMYHINAGIQQQFILKLAIVKNLNQFNMLIELFSLNIQDETTLNIVLDHVSKFPNDSTLLRKIDNKLIDSIHLNYYEIEAYLMVLKVDLANIVNNSQYPDDLFNFRICNKFDVIFNLLQVRRLYSDLYGFYQNYMVMDALFKLTTNNIDTKPRTEKVINQTDVLKVENRKDVSPPVIKPIYTAENTRFDNLLTLCINQSMKSFIINLACNYYVYISKNHCFIDKDNEDNLIKIQVCSLFPTNYIFNSSYIKSLVMSLTNYNHDDVYMRLTKLLNCLLSEDGQENTPLETMVILGMMYLYYLVFLHRSHSSYLLGNIDALFCDVVIQSRLFNNHTKIHLKRMDIALFLKETNIHDLAERDQDFNIVDLGEKYSHLANISETSFIDKIMGDLSTKTENKSVLLNSKRIINLNNLKNLKVAEAKKVGNIQTNSLLDPDNQLDFDQVYTNMFDYDFNTPSLTLANQYFNDFIQNQSDFLLRYKQKKINTKLVPVNVINLFGVVKDILYDQGSIVHTTNNTFVFYKEIISKVNDSSVFTDQTYLTIIYQIFIPFLFVNYNKIEFESTF